MGSSDGGAIFGNWRLGAGRVRGRSDDGWIHRLNHLPKPKPGDGSGGEQGWRNNGGNWRLGAGRVRGRSDDPWMH